MHLLFDLDGTLTDPFRGITRSLLHALTSLGLPAPSAESLRWCIGPPLRGSLLKLLGPLNEHLVGDALARYRERFGTTGLFENSVYPGIEEVLSELRDCGHALRLATSKPAVFAERILDHFKLTRFFDSIDGSELDGTRSDKPLLIAHILDREKIDPVCAIMIGDREHDMLGAHKNGIVGLGVLWGYGTRKELESANAAFCAEIPSDLVSLVGNLRNGHDQRSGSFLSNWHLSKMTP